MFIIFLVALFIRPFISSMAFAYLNLVYTQLLSLFLIAFIVYKKPAFLFLRPVIYPLISLFLALFISLVFSINISNSLFEIYKYVAGILLFFAAASLSGKEKEAVLRTIVLSGFCVSLLAIYQYFFGFSHLSGYLSRNGLDSVFLRDYMQSKRVFAPFITPGILGGYLVMVIPLCLYNKDRYLLLPGLAFALLLSQSLSAFFSLFCVLLVFSLLSKRLRKAAFLVIVGLFLATLALFILRSSGQKTHLQPLFSTLMRIDYWGQTIPLIKEHPFVGLGPGNFNLPLSRFAHNSYLQVWAELGLFGLLAFAWFLSRLFSSLFRMLPNFSFKDKEPFLLAAALIFLLTNLLDFGFFLPEVAFVWWVILGLMV